MTGAVHTMSPAGTFCPRTPLPTAGDAILNTAILGEEHTFDDCAFF